MKLCKNLCNTLDLKLYNIIVAYVAFISVFSIKKIHFKIFAHRLIPRVMNTCQSHSGEKRHIEKEADDHI